MRFSIPYGSVRTCSSPAPGAPAVELISVTAGYGHGRAPVLQDLNLTIPARVMATVVGPNGSGKSTLLKVITGILEPISGTVRTFGLGHGTCHHRVAYLPQRDQIQWQFPISVGQVVMMGRYVHLGWLGRPRPQDRVAVKEALEAMEIGNLISRQIHDLSGGQRQRVIIARALAQEADLFLFDEPLNALDAEAKATLCETLARLSRMGKTIIVATHEFTGFEGMFEMTVRMDHGHLVSVEQGVSVQSGVGT